MSIGAILNADIASLVENNLITVSEDNAVSPRKGLSPEKTRALTSIVKENLDLIRKIHHAFTSSLPGVESHTFGGTSVAVLPSYFS